MCTTREGWTSRLAAGLIAAALVASPAAALAQGFGQPGGLGPPGGIGGPTSSPKKQQKKTPEGEETHAAPTPDSGQNLQTQEPQLPQDPLALPDDVKKRVGSDYVEEPQPGRGTKTEHDFYGLYYGEKSGRYSFRTLFPLWFERKEPNDRASLFGLYYNRRSPKADADVLFPFFWRLREDHTTTTVVFPYMHRETTLGPGRPSRRDDWLFPLFFSGASSDNSGYFFAPLLATGGMYTSRGGFEMAGPLFCRWKGGPSCDPRTTDSIDLGLAPFYFYGRDEGSEYEIIPPLLHYYRYREAGNKSLNIWGPVLLEHDNDSDVVDVLPLFFHKRAKNEASTTLFPFFHYSYKGNENLIVTPLFVSARGEGGSSTFVTWGYARYRGRTELDMITPLFWQYRDPDIGLSRRVLFPFLYQNSSPRSEDLVVFPFYAHFNRKGISDQTWITPLFRYEKNTVGFQLNLFPLLHVAKNHDSHQFVLAPVLWDFASPKSRTTLALPFFARFADENTVTQILLNTYYRSKKVPGGTDWEFHFFPLFSYGQSPTGYFWNVLYGLAGYSQEGTASRMRALYIPIKLSK